jgi:hypothetical protein
MSSSESAMTSEKEKSLPQIQVKLLFDLLSKLENSSSELFEIQNEKETKKSPRSGNPLKLEKNPKGVKPLTRKLSVSQLTEQYETHTIEKNKSLTPRKEEEIKKTKTSPKINILTKKFESYGRIPIITSPTVMDTNSNQTEANYVNKKANEITLEVTKEKKKETEVSPKMKILGSGWVEYFDERSKRPYYYNNITLENVWIKPNLPVSSTTPLVSPISSGRSSPVVSTTVTQDASDPWKEFFDVKSGKPYFYNKITKETVWKKPKTESTPEVVPLIKEVEIVKLPTVEVTKPKFESVAKVKYFDDDDGFEEVDDVESDEEDQEIMRIEQQKKIEKIKSLSKESVKILSPEAVKMLPAHYRKMIDDKRIEDDEKISRPQGMKKETDQMMKMLTPEAIKMLTPETLRMLPPEYKKMFDELTKESQPPPIPVAPPSPNKKEPKITKKNSQKEIKKDPKATSFFSAKAEKGLQPDRHRSILYPKMKPPPPNEHNSSGSEHERLSPLSHEISYIDQEISTFDDQFHPRGSYDLSTFEKKKRISIFQTIANVIGPKELKTHSSFIAKRPSPTNLESPWMVQNSPLTPNLTPVAPEDESDIFYSDYHHFIPVDFDDYSHILEDTSWIVKEFNEKDYEEEAEEGEEISKNPLFEEYLEMLNPLYSESFVYENPFVDELVEYFNPLFNPNSNFLSDEIKESDFLLDLQKNLKFEDKVAKITDEFKLKTLYQCFFGQSLVLYIYEVSFPYFTFYDCLAFCQEMLNKNLFKNVYDIEAKTFIDDEYYRFTDTWEFCVENQLNIRVFSEADLLTFNPFEERMDSYILIRNIDNLMKAMLERYLNVNIYQKHVIKSVGYLVLWKSRYFREMKKQVYQLQKIDLLQFNENMRKSIMINIYNLMVLHALMKCKKPDKVENRLHAFHNFYYIIGKYKLTVESFEKQIFFDRRRTHPLSVQFDPRVHFALHTGSNSCPLLRYYPWDHDYFEAKKYKLDYHLKKSTKLFVRSEMIINDEEKEIKLPYIFKTYEDDFGDTLEVQLKFISQFVSKKVRDQFLKKTKTYSIDYLPEDTKFNQKTFKEQVQEFSLPFSEVRDNDRFRKYFVDYCNSEHSSENINCYEEIIKFNKIANPQERFAKACYIYEEFLAPSVAPQEININLKQIYRIEKEINLEKTTVKKNPNYKPNVVSTLFEEIRSTLNIVMLDTYARFKLSEIYCDLVEHCLDEILGRADEGIINKKDILKKLTSNK